MTRIAITRAVPERIGDCQLTHRERAPIDVALARRQHAAYEAALEELGCEIRRLPEEPEMADSVFVEDTAVVFDEVAVIARPGAPARRREVPSVEAALHPLRPLARIEGPGTLDGGDVLVIGRGVFVGLTSRTNEAGIERLRSIVAPHGYRVRAVEVRGCLHLKSAATALDDRAVLVYPGAIDPTVFDGLERIEVDPSEPDAANGLRIGDVFLHPAAFRRTARRIRTHGLRVVPLDLSELAKAEGAVTCCSLLVRTSRA